MIPSFGVEDLSRAEWRDVQRLLQAPALWAFALLAAQRGLPGAVEACRNPSPRDVEVLGMGGYTVDDLPPADDIHAALWGARIHCRRARVRRKNPPSESLQNTAEALGGDLEGAHAALRAYERFAGRRPYRFPTEATLP